jgi:ectoine hydroxylase-related dioxygenase (phytanoyl-CoA dioxygenase family)
MWRGAVGETEYLVNVMWPFTRYTAENGATIVWPDSHGRRALDPEPPAGEFAAELEPGFSPSLPRLDPPRRGGQREQ